MSLAATCSVSSTIGRRESPSRAPLTRARSLVPGSECFQHVASALGCEEGCRVQPRRAPAPARQLRAEH
jgi:hypothetical protein